MTINNAISPSKAMSLRDCPWRFQQQQTRDDVPKSHAQLKGIVAHIAYAMYGSMCFKKARDSWPGLLEEMFKREWWKDASDLIREELEPQLELMVEKLRWPTKFDVHTFEQQIAFTWVALLRADQDPDDVIGVTKIEECDWLAPEVRLRTKMDGVWISGLGKKHVSGFYQDLKSGDSQLAEGADAKVPQYVKGEFKSLPKDLQLRWSLVELRELYPDVTQWKVGHWYLPTADYCWTSWVKAAQIDAVAAAVWAEIHDYYSQQQECIKADEWPSNIRSHWCNSCEFGPVKGDDSCPAYRTEREATQRMIEEQHRRGHEIEAEGDARRERGESAPAPEPQKTGVERQRISSQEQAGFIQMLAARAKVFGYEIKHSGTPDQLVNVVALKNDGSRDELLGHLTVEIPEHTEGDNDAIQKVANALGKVGREMGYAFVPPDNCVFYLVKIADDADVVNQPPPTITAGDEEVDYGNADEPAADAGADPAADSPTDGTPADSDPAEPVPPVADAAGNADEPEVSDIERHWGGTSRKTYCDELPEDIDDWFLSGFCPDCDTHAIRYANGTFICSDCRRRWTDPTYNPDAEEDDMTDDIPAPDWGDPEGRPRKYKILLYGPPGVLKTRSALRAFTDTFSNPEGTKRICVIDTEDGTVHYVNEFRIKKLKNELGHDAAVTDVGYIEATVAGKVLPEGCEALLLDSFTIFCDNVYDKWIDTYLKREKAGKGGHHREYYVLQPRDHRNPQREIARMVNNLMEAPYHVIVTCQIKPIYNQKKNSGEMMEQIGEQADAWKKVAHYFDTVIQIVKDEEDPTKFWATVDKDRTNMLPTGRFEYTEHLLRDRLFPTAGAVADAGTKQWDEAGESEPDDAPDDAPAESGDAEPATPVPESEPADTLPPAEDIDTRPISDEQLHEIVAVRDKFGFEGPAYTKFVADAKAGGFNGEKVSARALNRTEGDRLIATMKVAPFSDRAE